MEKKLRTKLGKNELSWLKAKAKSVGITTNSTQSPFQQIYTLTEKLNELGYNDILEELRIAKADIVKEAQRKKNDLITWLYENQGEIRFGAENRIFVILVDSHNMNDSWKMKRAFNLIEPQIIQYLNNYNINTLSEVNFTFKKNTYKSLADAIFVVK